MKLSRVLCSLLLSTMVLAAASQAASVSVLNCPGDPWGYAEVVGGNINSIDRTATLEAWVLWSGSGKAQQVIMVQGELMQDWTLAMVLNSGNLSYKSRGADFICYSAKVQAGMWTHAAMTINENTGEIKYYINGEYKGSTGGGAITQNGYPFFLGGYWATWGGSVNLHTAPYSGKIAEARVWNVIRTDQEIRDNYGRIMQGNEPGLAASWFGGDNGLEDRTKNNNDLSLQHVYWHNVRPGWGTCSISKDEVPLSSGASAWVYSASDLDYDGDQKADIAVFSASEGNWYISQSSDNKTMKVSWGWSAVQPAPGDFDGDGKEDITVYHQALGHWYFLYSGGGSWPGYAWGWSRSQPVPADYDGDGKTDIAVYGMDNGNWYIIYSTGAWGVMNWGWSEAMPVPADYDGDGKDDLAVYWPAGGKWYIWYSGGGTLVANWGWSKTVPVPADYDGDGKAEMAVYNPDDSKWYIWFSTGKFEGIWGVKDGIPVAKDFNGDGKAEMGVYHPASGKWYINPWGSTYEVTFGWSGAKPTEPSLE